MHSFTRAIFLASWLSIASVWAAVAREPTELLSRQSGGGFSFDDPLKKVAFTKTSAGLSIVKAPSADSNSLDNRLSTMGLTLLSTDDFDEVHAATYALPAADISAKHTATVDQGYTEPLVRRDTLNIEGDPCFTGCGFEKGQSTAAAVPTDCKVVYEKLYTKAVRFTSQPRTVQYYMFGGCATFFVNNTPNTTAVYDYWDYAGATQYVNGACLIKEKAVIGTCLFQKWDSFKTGIYTSTNHPSYFGL